MGKKSYAITSLALCGQKLNFTRIKKVLGRGAYSEARNVKYRHGSSCQNTDSIIFQNRLTRRGIKPMLRKCKLLKGNARERTFDSITLTILIFGNGVNDVVFIEPDTIRHLSELGVFLKMDFHLDERMELDGQFYL